MDSFTFARPFCEECTERQSLFIINFCLVTWNLNGGLRKNWQKSSSNKKKIIGGFVQFFSESRV